MLDLIFYEDDQRPATPAASLAEALAATPGFTLEGHVDEVYRPVCFRDLRTGSRATGDLGPLPLAVDHLHPSRSYPGWRPVDLVLHLPIPVAHWNCIDVADAVVAMLDRLPHLSVLNSEATVRPGPDGEDLEGPGPLDKPTLLSTWEGLHAEATRSLQLPRLSRVASVALWRYRRGRTEVPKDWHGCEAHVLLHQGRARTAALLPWPLRPLVLPPVELLIHPGPPPRMVETASLRLLAPTLPLGGGLAFDRSNQLEPVLQDAAWQPITGFTMLADGDWGD